MAAVNEDFKKLVYVRVQALPDNTVVSIGGSGDISKAELLKHVEQGDEIGQKMYEIERAFFESLKNGSIYDELT